MDQSPSYTVKRSSLTVWHVQGRPALNIEAAADAREAQDNVRGYEWDMPDREECLLELRNMRVGQTVTVTPEEGEE